MTLLKVVFPNLSPASSTIQLPGEPSTQILRNTGQLTDTIKLHILGSVNPETNWAVLEQNCFLFSIVRFRQILSIVQECECEHFLLMLSIMDLNFFLIWFRK